MLEVTRSYYHGPEESKPFEEVVHKKLMQVLTWQGGIQAHVSSIYDHDGHVYLQQHDKVHEVLA